MLHKASDMGQTAANVETLSEWRNGFSSVAMLWVFGIDPGFVMDDPWISAAAVSVGLAAVLMAAFSGRGNLWQQVRKLSSKGWAVYADKDSFTDGDNLRASLYDENWVPLVTLVLDSNQDWELNVYGGFDRPVREALDWEQESEMGVPGYGTLIATSGDNSVYLYLKENPFQSLVYSREKGGRSRLRIFTTEEAMRALPQVWIDPGVSTHHPEGGQLIVNFELNNFEPVKGRKRGFLDLGRQAVNTGLRIIKKKPRRSSSEFAVLRAA
jgi:hypothetical protein